VTSLPSAGRAWTASQLKLGQVQLALMAATAATCLVSIFAAEVLLALGAATFLLRLAVGQVRLERLAVDGAVLAFCTWTLLSASFSPDPVTSHEEAKKLVLFAMLYLGSECLAETQRRQRILDAALLGGIVLGAGSLLQYYLLGFDTLNNRPSSFLGHYMTASGLSMGVLLLAAARLALGPRPVRPTRADLVRLAGLAGALAGLTALQAGQLFAIEGERLFVAGLAVAAALMAVSKGEWPGPATSSTFAALAVTISAWALLLSRTRNAWLGALVGLAVIALIRAPRSLWLLPAAIAAVLIARPAPVVERLTISDASSRDRYYMWQAGVDMIRDKPVFGQGPGMILSVYPKYRWPDAPNPQTPHLHNNPLQIAAERGLPGLAWWLWLVAVMMGDAYRESRRAGRVRDWSAVAALAILTGVLVSGLFEYNFGDSEILMFTLLVSAIPYALRRQRGERPDAATGSA
jgi:hypothetical protein